MIITTSKAWLIYTFFFLFVSFFFSLVLFCRNNYVTDIVVALLVKTLFWAGIHIGKDILYLVYTVVSLVRDKDLLLYLLMYVGGFLFVFMFFRNFVLHKFYLFNRPHRNGGGVPFFFCTPFYFSKIYIPLLIWSITNYLNFLKNPLLIGYKLILILTYLTTESTKRSLSPHISWECFFVHFFYWLFENESHIQ